MFRIKIELVFNLNKVESIFEGHTVKRGRIYIFL
jgi:hypothetical protein